MRPRESLRRLVHPFCFCLSGKQGMHFHHFRPRIYCSASTGQRMAGCKLHERCATEREDELPAQLIELFRVAGGDHRRGHFAPAARWNGQHRRLDVTRLLAGFLAACSMSQTRRRILSP